MVALGTQLEFLELNLFGAAWGAVAFPIYAIAVAHANDHASSNDYVMISSGLLLMYGIGAIFGPFLASTIMTYTSAIGLYVFVGVVHLLLLLYALLRMGIRESVPQEEQIEFGDAIAATHTASSAYEEELQNSFDTKN